MEDKVCHIPKNEKYRRVYYEQIGHKYGIDGFGYFHGWHLMYQTRGNGIATIALVEREDGTIGHFNLFEFIIAFVDKINEDVPE